MSLPKTKDIQIIRRHRLERALVAVLLIVVCAFLGFKVYVSDYYRAGDTAQSIFEGLVAQGNSENVIELEAAGSSLGLIFYPGAKVEYRAYLPLCEQLREAGISVYLVKMPYNLAFLGKNKADSVISAHPEIEHWIIGGHSLGGAMASSYASDHEDKVKGVVLLGAYLYGNFPLENSVTIYGSEDLILNKKKITYTENVHLISGGNHAQFGDYGPQKGDGNALITAEEQWDRTVNLILSFAESLEE